MAFCKPRRVVSEKENQKPANTLLLEFSFWNQEKMNYYNLSLPVCGICYGSPGKLIQPYMPKSGESLQMQVLMVDA